MTQRMLRLGLGALCMGLAAIIVAEVSVIALANDVSVTAAGKEAQPPEMRMPANIDSMVAVILERPLFASARIPYEEAVATDNDDAGDEAPQQLQARLTGVAILPEGREALFEREGSKPVAVKEGSQIDGWTVKAIRTDQVVISNAMGETVLEPTKAPTIRRPRVAANSATAAQAQQKGAPTARAPQPASARRQDQK